MATAFVGVFGLLFAQFRKEVLSSLTRMDDKLAVQGEQIVG